MDKLIALFTVLIFSSLIAGCGEQTPDKEILYIGTGGGNGLFVLEFDRSDHTFTQLQHVTERVGGFQAIHPNGEILYSVAGPLDSDSNHGSVSAYRIDQEDGTLTYINSQSSHGSGPAHVSVDPQGRFVYVSNYGGGNLSSLPVRDDGGLAEAVSMMQHEGSSVNERRQQRAHMHAADPSPDGRFLYAIDLGIDKVMIYAVDQDTGELSPAESPYIDIEPGSGPRHFTFHPEFAYAYTVDELSSTITVMSADRGSGALEQIQRVDMLPAGYDEESWAADIHISPDGRFLYATNRGHDSTAIYSIDQSTGHLELLDLEPTRGGHPRNFAIDILGDYIFMTNRDGDANLVLFERDADTGLLNYAGVELEFPSAICVTQLFL